MVRRIVSCLISLALVGPFAHAAELTAWSPQAEDHPTTLALEAFLAQVKDSPVRFEPRMLPTASIDTQTKLVRGLQKGEIGVAVLTQSTAAKFAPMSRVLSLPFLFKDSRQMFSQLDADVGKDLEASMAEKGIIVLGWYDGGTRSLYLRAKPPRSLAELAGLKVRVPARPDLRTVVSQLGGVPQTLAYDQINSAFDDGSIDGAENDLLSYESDQHYKHAPYFLQINHAVQFEVLVMSATVWNQLSDSGRKAVLDAGHASALGDRDMWSKRVAAARTRLEKNGVKFFEQRDNSVFFPRVSDTYKPFLDNPATSGLLLKLMTSHS